MPPRPCGARQRATPARRPLRGRGDPGMIAELAERLRRRETTPQELAREARGELQRISGLNAVLRYTDALAERQAERAPRKLSDRPELAGPLCGIPFAYKDVLCVEGVETTAGSRILRGYLPPYTGTALQRLLDAGAIPVAVTNCDEFAMGSSTENSAFGAVANPWDVGRVPGGSGALRPRHGHRRLDPAAGLVLRGHRLQAHP